MTEQLMILIFILGGYLSGSVLYAFLIPYLLNGIDIRVMSPDRNPGTSNVFRVCGVKTGILVAVMEFSKGFLPVAMGLIVLDMEAVGYWFVAVILAPVIGHMFSALNLFRGGVGIAPAFGTLIAVFLETRLLIIIVTIYAVGRFGIHFKSDRSRTDFVFITFMLIVLLFESNPAYRLAYILVSLAVLLKNQILKAGAAAVNDCAGQKLSRASSQQ